MRSVTLPPANWYPDPGGDGLRYWDGAQWTDHRAPGPKAAPAPTAAAIAASPGWRQWWRSGWAIAAAIILPTLLLLVVVGAIGNALDPTDPEAATSTKSKGQSAKPSGKISDRASAKVDATTPKPSPSPSKSTASKPSTRKAPAARRITGYGANKDDWLASHTQAPGYSKGAVFLPYVKTEESDTQPKYAAVELDTPVVSYIVNLPKGTSLAEAKPRSTDGLDGDRVIVVAAE